MTFFVLRETGHPCAEITANAKRRARTGEYYDVRFLVAPDSVEHLDQLLVHRAVYRVASVRAGPQPAGENVPRSLHLDAFEHR